QNCPDAASSSVEGISAPAHPSRSTTAAADRKRQSSLLFGPPLALRLSFLNIRQNSSDSAGSTKKVAGERGCQPPLKFAWALPPLEPHQNKEHRQECLCYSSCKRAAAAAVARRIGILENESLAHESLFVLQRRAIQVEKTF